MGRIISMSDRLTQHRRPLSLMVWQRQRRNHALRIANSMITNQTTTLHRKSSV